MITTQKPKSLRYVYLYLSYLIIAWTFFRFLFELPQSLEELLIKPTIWLLPLYFLLKNEKKGLKSLGLTIKRFFPSIYFVLALGAGFALLGVVLNIIKYGSINFNADVGNQFILVSLFISLATAFTEEISFRGYLFNRVWKATKNEWLANFVISLFWAFIHLPIAIVLLQLGTVDLLIYLFLIFIFGFGSSFVFARTGNVFASILLHVLWEWPIVLFR